MRRRVANGVCCMRELLGFKKNLICSTANGRRNLIKSLMIATCGLATGISLMNLLPTSEQLACKTRLILRPTSSDLLSAVEQLSSALAVKQICPEIENLYSKALVSLRTDFLQSGRLLSLKKYRNNGQIVYESVWKSSKDFQTFFDSPQLQGTLAVFKRRGFELDIEIVS